MASTQDISAIRTAVAACFAENKQPLTMSQAKAWIATKYSNRNFDDKAVHGQIRAACINKHYTRTERRDAPKILFYDTSTRTYRAKTDTDPTSTDSADPDSQSDDDSLAESSDVQGAAFALERHLRDFLARNLSQVEQGLQLWTLDPPSIEYPLSDTSGASTRFIDILAKDLNGVPVILELKLNRAHDKVIGQALLYRGRLRKQLNVSTVRIVLIAFEISDELRMACGELPNVSLFEYAIRMELTPVRAVDDRS